MVTLEEQLSEEPVWLVTREIVASNLFGADATLFFYI